MAWIKKTYFRRSDMKEWHFFGKNPDGKHILLFLAAKVPIQRHVKIKGEANPYDPQYEHYFEERLTQQWLRSDKGKGKLLRLWYIQKGICYLCHQGITAQTGGEIHRIVEGVKGGKETMTNMQLVHPHCHQLTHSPERNRVQQGLRKA
ncbi:MAG: HNH endonuclease [SAR324 cluster bacterium]|nr:HNH endonuclease [SAR324 cluster bacterium]